MVLFFMLWYHLYCSLAAPYCLKFYLDLLPLSSGTCNSHRDLCFLPFDTIAERLRLKARLSIPLRNNKAARIAFSLSRRGGDRPFCPLYLKMQGLLGHIGCNCFMHSCPLSERSTLKRSKWRVGHVWLLYRSKGSIISARRPGTPGPTFGAHGTRSKGQFSQRGLRGIVLS